MYSNEDLEVKSKCENNLISKQWILDSNECNSLLSAIPFQDSVYVYSCYDTQWLIRVYPNLGEGSLYKHMINIDTAGDLAL